MTDQSLPKPWWRKLPEYIAIAALAAMCSPFVIRIMGTHAYLINSGNMVPTLTQDDRVWSDDHPQSNGLQRSQIIVYRPPKGEADDPPFLNRLIGLPGDTIAIKDGKVILNGKPLKETYIAEPVGYTMPLFKVPPGEYFVLGDNRNNSADSHVWGSVLTPPLRVQFAFSTGLDLEPSALKAHILVQRSETAHAEILSSSTFKDSLIQ